MTRSIALALLVTLPGVVASCGTDDSPRAESAPLVSADAAAATVAAESTVLSDSTTVPLESDTGTSGTTPATPETSPASSDEAAEAAGKAWTTVFDSTVNFADKGVHLADAEALGPTVDSYSTAGASMGGIMLVPTAVVVAGDVATVTYDVMFGGTVAYTALIGTIERVDGVWVVSRDEFCGFMESARNPCP